MNIFLRSGPRAPDPYPDPKTGSSYLVKVALLVLGLEILTWPCVCVRGPGLVPGPEEDQVHQVPHRPQHQNAGAKAGEQRHLFHKEKNNHS